MAKAACNKYGFVGPEMCGKTSAAIKMSKKERLCIRVDINRSDSLADGAIIIYSKQDLPRVIKERDGRKKMTICFRGSEMPGMSIEQSFAWVCRVAAAVEERCAILADECDTLIPKLGHIDPHVDAVLRRGRQHLQVPLYWTALRPAQLNTRLRDISNQIMFFGDFSTTYHDFISKFLDKEAANEVRNLEKYHYILTKQGEKWQKKPPLKL